MVKSYGWYCLRVPHVCSITKMPLSYELWKLKTAKSCFQFPLLITQKLDNWVMETELRKQSYRLSNNLFAMGPTIFELWVMETKNWVTKKANPNAPLIYSCDYWLYSETLCACVLIMNFDYLFTLNMLNLRFGCHDAIWLHKTDLIVYFFYFENYLKIMEYEIR